MQLKSRVFAYLDAARLFALVAERPWAMFLDSGVTDENRHLRRKHADYDVLAFAPSAHLVYHAGSARIARHGSEGLESHITDDPLPLLRALLNELAVEHDDPKPAYQPGLIGYFAYDFARNLESIPEVSADQEDLPDIAMGLYPVVVVVDHIEQCTSIVFCEGYPHVESIVADWQSYIELLSQPTDPRKEAPASEAANVWHTEAITSDIDFAAYQAKFDQVQAYIRAGDCYQVNLTKRFTARVSGNSWSTYVKLRSASPAPYAAYLNLPFATVLSNSPESFIQCREQQIVTSPIKGTRPRDHRSKFKDRMAADELLNSAKDRAENLMIVDLMRNDLSRCCELGSVKVPKLFALHSFANVHHLISTVVGRLRNDLDALDLLKGCFPGGSITGAPKIRAMQIIEELESCRRGLYCGSIGYLGSDGNLETNIAIRTMVLKEGIVRYSAGGGLVLDSCVSDEYQELNDKASMMSSVITEGES